MEVSAWYDDPAVLFDNKYVLDFWPSVEQSPEERVNAMTRFVMYASATLFAMTRDLRVLSLGALVVSVAYVLYRGDRVSFATNAPSSAAGNCAPVSQDNAMNNPLTNEFNTDRVGRCGDVATAECPLSRMRVRDRGAPAIQCDRQFVQVPVHDQDAFVREAYGTGLQRCHDGEPGECADRLSHPGLRARTSGAF